MALTVKETYKVNKKGKDYIQTLEGHQTEFAMLCVEFNEGIREIIIKEEVNLEARVFTSYRKRQAFVEGIWVDVAFPNGNMISIHRATEGVYVDTTTGDVVDESLAVVDGDLQAGYAYDVDNVINNLGPAHHNIHETIINKSNGIN